MDKKNLVIAIYDGESGNQGNYNTPAVFSDGLLKGFNEIGIKACRADVCFEEGINPNIAIGFNTCGVEHWQKLLNKNITNIMWSIDSVFYQNYDVVSQFASYKNFVLFNSSANDSEPVKHYFPELVHGYIPCGVDLNFWKKLDVEKDFDILFLGSIDDYEAQIQKLKEIMPNLVFNLMIEFIEVAMVQPALSLWDIYLFFKKQLGLEFDASQYVLMAKSISYIITYKQRLKMLETLKDFNITICGDGTWEKFLTGNMTLKKASSPRDVLELMNRAKIVLHSQPFQLSGGIDGRVLNASAVETMVLTAQNPILNVEFGDVFAYCNPVTYEDIAQKASYYLEHDDERIGMAQKASQIVKQKHKWSDRAQSIADIIN